LINLTQFLRTDLIDHLLKSNVKINARDENGNTALMIAVTAARPAAGTFLTRLYSLHSKEEVINSNIEEHTLDARKRFKIVSMLLEHKADINARNNNNQTALSLAMTQQYNENIIALLKANKAIE